MDEKKARILVIDDQLSEVKMINMMLEQAGYEIVYIHNGKDGIKKAIKEDFDLVLTDMVMPDIDGMRVLREVKKSKPHLPVIMMTGHASVKTAVQAMKLGAHHYLEKGFTPLELISEIESAFYDSKKHQFEEREIIPQGRDEWLEHREQSLILS